MKTSSISILLILGILLLTGCNNAVGTDAKSVQVVGIRNKTAGDKQDIPSDSRAGQLEEELRLANERIKLEEGRAKLAEDQAALEKQKREFAEEQLKNQKELSQATGAETLQQATPSQEQPYPRAIPRQRRQSPIESNHARRQVENESSDVEDNSEEDCDCTCQCVSEDDDSGS